MIESYTSLINTPYKLDQSNLMDLKDLLRKYPFCQSAQILYLLNLIKLEEDRNDIINQQSMAAIYITDRKLLKNLCDTIESFTVNQKEIPKEIVVESIIEPPQIEPEIVKEEVIIEEKEEKETDSRTDLINIIQKRLSEINKEKTEIEQVSTEKTEEFNQEIKDANELIEKFLKEQPKINSPKKEKEYVEDLEKNSLADNDDIISETLASIYEKQGYLTKAIKIYNKLILKFPEKSSYFANQIQKLKKISNQ